MAKLRRQSVGFRVSQLLLGILIGIWSMVPLYWGVVIALSTQSDIHADPVSLVPSSLTIENFRHLLGGTTAHFYQAMFNSIIQATGSTVLTLLIAMPAAYAFSRLRFRGSTFLLAIITATLAVPIYLVLIPLFQLASATGQLNTQQAVILVLASASLPLAIWIIRSHMASLPQDLESAARLDGAGTFIIMTKIIGPLAVPGLVAAAIVVFLASWGAFLIPLVYANSAAMQPLTVLIPTFGGKVYTDFGLQAAAGLVAVTPPILLVIFLQKHLLSGLLKGAYR